MNRKILYVLVLTALVGIFLLATVFITPPNPAVNLPQSNQADAGRSGQPNVSVLGENIRNKILEELNK